MFIRSANSDDAEKLAALAIQVWLHTYATAGISSAIAAYVLSVFSKEKFLSRLMEKSSSIFVAEFNKNLVGYAICDANAHCPAIPNTKVELSTLYVQAHFSSRGIGSSLLQQAEAWAKQQADTALWLTVNSQNARAKAFYTKHGYTSVGITHFRLGQEDHENDVMVGIKR